MQQTIPNGVGERHVIVVAGRQCRNLALYTEQVIQEIALERFLAHRDPFVFSLRVGAAAILNLCVHKTSITSVNPESSDCADLVQ